MHDDDMVPNVRTPKKEKTRHGNPKTILECHVGEVVLLAVRVCRLTAGPGGGKEPTGAFVNVYDRKTQREIFDLLTINTNVPVETDGGLREQLKLMESVRHLLPHPDKVGEEDAKALRKFNRSWAGLED